LANNNDDLRRILLVRNDRIGDLVLTMPAFEAVRRSWPRAHVTALVSPYAAPLLGGARGLDEVLVVDPKEKIAALAARLRAMRFDAAIVFSTNTRNCLAVWMARIPQRVCWAYKPVGFLTGNRRVALRRSHPPIHETDFTLAFVRRLGGSADVSAYLPKLEIDAATHQRVAARIEQDLGSRGPLFGVHPGNSHSAYNWPPSHYAQLVARLAQNGRVMLTGSPIERTLLDWVRGQLPANVRNRVAFYSDFTLPELAAALTQQTALTVSSTGPMHMAAVLGTPVVALFSPHPAHVPAKWRPLGDNHTILVAPYLKGEDPRVPPHRGAAVMSRIRIEQVLAANLQYAGPGTSDRIAPLEQSKHRGEQAA
jgi:ADP-heptose:LPS heptosyltransferase